MSVRLRRLKADYERIRGAFTPEARIRLLDTVGDPPEKYQIEFFVPGLQLDPATKAVRRHNHFVAEITLTNAYPRMSPQCRMLTPIFHPNIAPHAICIGDHWAAGESLPNLIVRIAEMIVFQSYNVKSPLNGEAAKWVEKNAQAVPLEDYDFSSLLDEGGVLGYNADGSLRVAEGTSCANCGVTTDDLKACVNGHVVCRNCSMACPSCGNTICLQCKLYVCGTCGKSVCSSCIRKCPGCGKSVCQTHAGACAVCSLEYCQDCLIACAACGKSVCVEHAVAVEVDGAPGYACQACVEEAQAEDEAVDMVSGDGQGQ
jgi:ubiquitin-protein ligase